MLALALLAGAGSEARAQGTTPQGTAARAAMNVSRAQFGGLRWLSGDWRGRLPDGTAFHERYRFADDSTIVVSYFDADSTFKNAGRSDTISLRGGVVRNGGATLTRLNDSGLSFAQLSQAEGGYDFARLPGGSWTATIVSSKNGKPSRVVYHMQRVR